MQTRRKNRGKRQRASIHRSRRFSLETLEDRRLLATLVVDDDGGGDHATIAAAIDDAISGDTIQIVGGLDRIHHEQGISVNKTLTFQGAAGSTQVSIVSDGTDRIFEIAAGTADVAINDLKLTGGDSAEAGGAINNSGDLALRRVTISGNTAETSGGGLRNNADATTHIIDSTLDGNEAANGGAIMNLNGTVRIANSTISGNTATGAAGAVLSIGDSAGNFAFATILQSTVTGNSSMGTGSVHAVSQNGADGSEIRFGNTIFVNNNTDLDPSLDAANVSLGTFDGLLDAELNSLGNNLLDDGGSESLIGSDIGDVDTSATQVIEPTLRRNGGPTRTHALVAGSPAIDTGNNALATSTDGSDLLTDQRQLPFARVTNGGSGTATVDIGAYEAQACDAASFVVTTLTDELDYTNGDVSLREALNSANGNIGDDEIAFAPELTSSGAATITLSLGELLITDSVTIDGPGQDFLTIDADQKSRVLNIEGDSTDVTLDGLTLTGGKTTGSNLYLGGGAGRETTHSGGGIRFNSSGTLTLTGSTLSGNHTEGDDAGGGGVFASGAVNMFNSTVSENSTAGIIAHGGGVFASGAIIMSNSTVTGNSTALRFADGGGVFGADTITLTNSTVSRNRTNGFATSGGGIFASGAVTLTNSTVAGNSMTDANSYGGGIASDASVTMTNSVVSGNSTTGPNARAGGIYTQVLTMTNSIVAGNTTYLSTYPEDISSGERTLTHSIIGHGSGLASTNGAKDGDGNIIGGDWKTVLANDGTDPILKDNGGPTQTIALIAGSPAIDAGDDSLAKDPDGNDLVNDQRGAPFVRRSGTVDIGAYEYQTLDASSFVVTTLADELDYSNNDGVSPQVSLREAINSANYNPGADTITFDEGVQGAIELELGELVIIDAVTITAAASDRLTIDAQNTSRVINVMPGKSPSGDFDVNLDALTLVNAQTTDDNEDIFDSTHNGGGIRFNSSGTLSLTNSTISGNSTTGFLARGGAVWAFGDVTLINSTVSGNSTLSGDGASHGAAGGGIYAKGDVTLINSTISGNSIAGNGAVGGGVRASGATLTNSIVTGNSAVNSFSPDISAFDLTATHSIIGDTEGVSIRGTGNQVGIDWKTVLENDGTIPILNDNGGPTQTIALIAGSPAIDAGDDSLAKDADGNDILRDQRGAPFIRRFGTVDIGAYECQSPPASALVVTTLADEVDCTDDVVSLREALLRANGSVGLDEITFAPELTNSGPATIMMSLGEFVITDETTITGPGANQLTIDAQQNSRGIHVPAGDANVTLRGLTLTGGSTTDTDGGGIRFLSTGTLTLQRSTLSGNTTTQDGGGLYSKDGNVVIQDSTVSGNTAPGSSGDGGGIYLNSGALTVENSTVSGNSVGDDGGGLYSAYASVTLQNSTITNNDADRAGGVFIFDSAQPLLTSINSIVAQNTGTTSHADFHLDADAQMFEYSLIGDNAGTQLDPAPVGSPDANGNLVGTRDSEIDARLGPLADNGGPTKTHALLEDSPAIDAGKASLLSTDQRGFARTVDLLLTSNATGGDGTDMGSLEVPDPTPTLDFGDAPEDYPVTSAQNGASHVVGALFLGASVDAEIDGQPAVDANGDGDDDDGVFVLASMIASPTSDTVSSFGVLASAAGKLDAWIDFDQDNIWQDAEQIFVGVNVVAGANTLSYTIPAGTIAGEPAARFRLSADGVPAATGPATDGEVEDYLAVLETAGSNTVEVESFIPGTVTIETNGADVVVREGDVTLYQGPADQLAVLDFLGTSGDDTIVLSAIIADFTGGVKLAGDSGTDTLQVAGENQTLDATTLADGAVTGLEVIDIRGSGANSLKLRESDVSAIPDSGQTLKVLANPDDTVELVDGEFKVDDSMVEDGQFFVQAQSASATIQIGGLGWTNPLNRLDVNNSGDLEPIDVLQILNQLTTRTFVQAGTQATLIDPANLTVPFPFRFFDTSGNGQLEPLDLLRVLNGLTRQGEREAPEGEPGAISLPVSSIDEREDAIESVRPLESIVRALDAVFSEPEASSSMTESLDLWSFDESDKEESDDAIEIYDLARQIGFERVMLTASSED